MIERLRVVNFRSFGEVEIELRPLNVVVGANASGKSNLVQVFRFLRDLARYGLANTLSLQSGISKVSNLKTGSDTTEIGVEYSLEGVQIGRDSKKKLIIKRIHHSIAFDYHPRTQSPRIIHEHLSIGFAGTAPDELNWLRVERKGKEVKVLSEAEILSGTLLGSALAELSEDLSLTQIPLAPYLTAHFTEAVAVYNFHPHFAKQAIPTTGSLYLEEDGRNLTLVLQRILKSPKERRNFLNLVRDLLPHLQSLKVESLLDSSLTLQAQEIYFGKRYLPAMLLSDGTMEVIALLVALYFCPAMTHTLVFEEPDRNLHPILMAKLMETFRDVTHRHQVVLTTHNPELVDCAKVEELLLIERDKEGFSVVKRPAEQKMVQEFLKEQLGLGTLHKDRMLGAQ